MPVRGKPTDGDGRISVLLVDDHAVVRGGLRALLEIEKDIMVVGEAEDGRQAVEMATALDPDVVVMDIGMPRLNGIDATRQLRKVAPRSRVLILSAHSDDPYIARVMSLGAVGYALKQSSPSLLVRAIRNIHAGAAYVSPAVLRRLRTPGSPPAVGDKPQTGGIPRLSDREAEVLQRIAEGRANKQVAAELGISVKTVEKHRQRLMLKLDVHDVAGLVRYAVTAGFVECRTQASRR